jgi:hypothetical protein
VHNYNDAIELYVWKIKQIAKENGDGFTIILPLVQKAQNGIVAAYSATQDSFDDEGLRKVIKHAFTHDRVVGGWFNKDDKNYYYDSCRIFHDRIQAIEFGRQNNQISIYDIDNNEVIYL